MPEKKPQPQRPCVLEVNNTGAWKRIGNFDASDQEKNQLVESGAESLSLAFPKTTFRIATAESPPHALLYLEDGIWRKA